MKVMSQFFKKGVNEGGGGRGGGARGGGGGV